MAVDMIEARSIMHPPCACRTHDLVTIASLVSNESKANATNAGRAEDQTESQPICTLGYGTTPPAPPADSNSGYLTSLPEVIATVPAAISLPSAISIDASPVSAARSDFIRRRNAAGFVGRL